MNETAEHAPIDVDALWERIHRDLHHTRVGYPVEAATLLRAHREQLIPKMLDEFAAFAENPMQHVRDEKYILHFHLITFFAEFRETRAYPLLVAAMRQCAEDLDYVFGDYITETMGRALAGVCNGDTALLEAYANDVKNDPWGRNACLVAITTRALEGDLTPQEAAQRIERIGLAEAARQINLPPEERDDIFLTCLVGELLDLRAISALPNIRHWYSQDLVDPTIQGDLKKIEYLILKDGFEAQQAETRRFENGYVQDAVKELGNWAVFDPPREQKPEIPPKPLWPADGLPFEHPLPKTGRNDPCPCGSGKKYKKCCGA